MIHQLVDKEDHLKKELQNKSRSEERLLEEKEGLLKVGVVFILLLGVTIQPCVLPRPIDSSRSSWTDRSDLCLSKGDPK